MANRNGNEDVLSETNNQNGTNMPTAHDWEGEKRSANDFYDLDGSNNFFW